MDELMISGRRYLSAGRAAKEHGYHSDYIGQLIRGGKVKGQKVGRAWYVDAESLAVYLGKEISQAVAEQEKLQEEIATIEVPSSPESPLENIQKSEQSVPVIKNEEAIDPEEHPIAISRLDLETPEERKIKINKQTPKKEGVDDGGLSYISDDEPLLPEIRKDRIIYREPEATIIVEPNIDEEATPHQKGSYLKQGVALFGIGVVVLIAVTALSSLLVFTMSVGSSETASVQFSLPQ